MKQKCWGWGVSRDTLQLIFFKLGFVSTIRRDICKFLNHHFLPSPSFTYVPGLIKTATSTIFQTSWF